jgi:hypothetical protein
MLTVRPTRATISIGRPRTVASPVSSMTARATTYIAIASSSADAMTPIRMRRR